MKQRADALGIGIIVLAAMSFGTLGPLARFAAEAGFTAVSFAVWRAIVSVMALALLLAVGVVAGRVQTTRPGAIARLEWLQLGVMGIFVAGTTLSLFSAFERTSIAVALMVFYTFPIMVALAAVPVYGEHLGRRKAAAMSLATLGLVMLLLAPETDGGGLGLDLVGVLFALVAALCQVGYALVGARGFASVPALQSATILRGFSVLSYVAVLVPLILLTGQGDSLIEPAASAEAWLLGLVAGSIGAALPTVFLIAGYRRVGPTRGAVLMLVEPVTGVFLAALLLAERPTALQLVGGVLVFAGAGLVQLGPVARPAAQAQPAAE